MDKVISYKCPNCAAPLVFDSKKQLMLCDSCKNTFTTEQIDSFYGSGDDNADKIEIKWTNENNDDVLENVTVYSCPSCGAEIVADENTAATECLYCGNQAIIPQKLSGANKPDYIIPFKLGKNDARNTLKNFYKKKLLIPKLFKDENRIDMIKGVYVPFWLFDCDVSADMRFNAKRTHAWSDKSYNYVRTDHYIVERSGEMCFEKIPVDGSSKMQDAYMDAIEPFNYNELESFSPSFLSGYLADKYDVGSEESSVRANARIDESVRDAFTRTVTGYSSVTPKSCSIKTTNGKVRYALFPVWILNTKYKDKMYTFALNGQTGKMVGRLPVDRLKFWGLLAGVFAALTAIGQIFVFLN
ncbi:MAG: hypothetical protein GX107_09040 [Clostridiales bacterium]|nr:hypothetical protein [Clostridiales bacterium]